MADEVRTGIFLQVYDIYGVFWYFLNFMEGLYLLENCTDKYSQHSSIIWSVWLNGWVFIYELRSCGFESCWSHSKMWQKKNKKTKKQNKKTNKHYNKNKSMFINTDLLILQLSLNYQAIRFLILDSTFLTTFLYNIFVDWALCSVTLLF